MAGKLGRLQADITAGASVKRKERRRWNSLRSAGASWSSRVAEEEAEIEKQPAATAVYALESPALALIGAVCALEFASRHRVASQLELESRFTKRC